MFNFSSGLCDRLYPLTENFPKPLLKVQDKTILDWLIDDIDSLGQLDEYVVISNETRLGAVRDIQFAIDENDKVLRMTEKSPEPETHWCCPPFYYYTREDAKLIPSGIEAGCGVDAPGSYIAWLCTQVPVHAMEMPGSRYDIGNLESYEQVQKDYKGI